MNLDISRFGLGAIVYYMTSAIKVEESYSRRSQIQLILFLSRLLKDIKTRYWSIELEIVGIIWVLRKIRYLIELALKTIIYIDYKLVLRIAK